jgi:hypothetical protein
MWIIFYRGICLWTAAAVRVIAVEAFQASSREYYCRSSRDGHVVAVMAAEPKSGSSSPPDSEVKDTGADDDPAKASSSSSSQPHLIFPGGGIYFYWQAGAVTFLRENGYDLERTSWTGASAGALTATLAATGVDFYDATDRALALAKRSGVWRRTGGLQGIWGDLIYEWLDALIPDTAVDDLQRQPHAQNKLTLLVTPFPNVWDEKIKVQFFHDKRELIAANMASIHLPWFLNSKLTATFRGRSVLDGSFLAQAKDYHYRHPASNNDDDDVMIRNDKKQPEKGVGKKKHHIIMDYKMDPLYRDQSLLSFIETVEPAKIRQMLEDGKRYAQRLEEQGYFATLRRSQK